MKCDKHEGQWMEAEQDELVRRLRRLEWPAAPDTVKRRCWEDLSRQLELGHTGAPRVAEKARRNIGERYDYSRRSLVSRGESAGSRLGARRSWARPSRTLSLA